MKKNNFFSKRNIEVFNTPLELGLRALIILKEAAPNSLDLNRIIIYDYILTHSEDVDEFMQSLHPAIPNRFGELALKRKIMQEGLNLMCSRELIDIEYTENGINYKANKLSEYFVRYFDSSYANSLVEYSQWLNNRFSNFTDSELNSYINKNISKWGSEFTKESLIRGVFIE
ncbi:ABC-three component system middle component 2 [Bacillus gobiensis]|uniref:ABC-three component system middle component 2 n=1 Tax=Bacillus gobiensis TaxID=1441095 RepID=UPI003D1EAC8D